MSPHSNTSSCFPAWCPFFLCYLLTRAFRNSARSSRVRTSGLEERKHFDNAERPRPFDCQSRRCAFATTLQIAIVFRSCIAEKNPVPHLRCYKSACFAMLQYMCLCRAVFWRNYRVIKDVRSCHMHPLIHRKARKKQLWSTANKRILPDTNHVSAVRIEQDT